MIGNVDRERRIGASWMVEPRNRRDCPTDFLEPICSGLKSGLVNSPTVHPGSQDDLCYAPFSAIL